MTNGKGVGINPPPEQGPGFPVANPPGTSTNTLVLIDGAQSVTLYPGLVIMLPQGATWLSLGTVGTSAPFVVGDISSLQSGVFTILVTWMLNGITHITNLTISVPVLSGAPTTTAAPITLQNLRYAAEQLGLAYFTYGAGVICNGTSTGKLGIVQFQQAWNAAVQAGTLVFPVGYYSGALPTLPVDGVYVNATAIAFHAYAAVSRFYTQYIPPTCPVHVAPRRPLGVGDGAPLPPNQHPAIITVTAANNGQTIQLQHVGDGLVVQLPVPPSYIPTLTTDGVIHAASSPTIANGVMTQRYTATAVGTTVLFFGTIDTPVATAGQSVSFKIIVGIPTVTPGLPILHLPSPPPVRYQPKRPLTLRGPVVGYGKQIQSGLGALQPNPFNSMTAGNLILPNHAIYSLTKNHALVMQSDGNLVVYDISWEAIWAAGINGKGGVRAIMQGDGNFVVYKSYTSMSPSEAVWSTGTYNNPGAWITMQDDGNLVVYNAAGTRALWASNSVWNQVGQ